MDEPRRSPGPFPSLAVRERGNYISVRQGRGIDGGWGTLNRPLPLTIVRLGQQRLPLKLGYETTPSTMVWAFEVGFNLRLQVDRNSDDRYANCVAVALLDGNNRRVAPLVASASGRGESVVVPPGRYKLIASLGIAEEVSLELTVRSSPPVGLPARARVALRAIGELLRAGAQGAAVVAAGGAALLAARDRFLGARALLAAGGEGLIRPLLQSGEALAAVGGSGALTATPVALLSGEAAAAAGGVALRLPVVWLNEPASAWRARRNGDVLEINRAYVAAATTEAGARLQLQQLRQALAS